MTKPKPVPQSRAEFFVDDVPEPVVKDVKKALAGPPTPVVDEPVLDNDGPVLDLGPPTQAAAAPAPAPAAPGIDLPRGQGLVIAQNVPEADDPGALLRQLTSGMPAGAMRPGEIADTAERERHNAHVELERMIDLEQRRKRRAAQSQGGGKPKRKR